MTAPEDRGPDGGEPRVSTAPAVTPAAPAASAPPDEPRRPRWWSAIPRHLGRARTSTVALGLLFLLIGALYLNVRPDPPGMARTPEEPAVEETAEPTAETTPPTTETTEPADETDEAPETTPAQPTREPAEPTRPTEPTEPEETAEETPPTTSAPETGEPSQPTATPPG